MELIADLSRPRSKRKKRRQKFLLPETIEKYAQFLEQAKSRRRATVGSIFAAAHALSRKAEELSAKAQKLRRSTWPSEAETELARRDALSYRTEAKTLRKERRAFLRRGWRFRLLFWQLPDRFDPESKVPPGYSHWSCRAHAGMLAHMWEGERIAAEGAPLLVTETMNEYWRNKRSLMSYQGRFFLVMQHKRTHMQPHDPWQIQWVSESTAQMTEAELRAIANLEVVD